MLVSGRLVLGNADGLGAVAGAVTDQFGTQVMPAHMLAQESADPIGLLVPQDLPEQDGDQFAADTE